MTRLLWESLYLLDEKPISSVKGGKTLVIHNNFFLYENADRIALCWRHIIQISALST